MGASAVTDYGEFNSKVMSRLGRVSSRLRWYAAAGGLSIVLVTLLAGATVQLILDYTFRLPTDMRATLSAGIAVLLAAVLWRRVVRPIRYPIGATETASLIERRFPDLQSVLISSVQFAGGDVGSELSNSRAMMRVVVDRAVRETEKIPILSVLDPRPARRSLISSISVFAVGVGAFALQPELMGLWFDRNVLLMNTPWPQRTRFVVEAKDGELTAARGDDLEIRARVEGDIPRDATIAFESQTGQGGRESMIGVGERGFRYTFAHVEEPFRFRLIGGDDQTDWFSVQLADRPDVEALRIRVAPPAYARIEAFDVPPDQRAVEALRGSQIAIAARMNKPVMRADLMAEQELIAPATGTGDSWRVSFSPDETRTYHFALEDDLHLTNKRPMRISIRIVKDGPPRVTLKTEGVSDIVTPQALLPLELSFSDAYGLAHAELVHQLAREGSGAEIAPLDGFKPGMTIFETKASFPVGSLSVIPGDRLTLYGQGGDYDDVSGPNESQSGAVSLRVVTIDEFQAEIARREQEYRQEFERVIEQQEELRRELLTVIGLMRDESQRAGIGGKVVPLERRQRQIAGQVNVLRQQFEQTFAELKVNGLDTTAVRERLDEGIVKPLGELTRRGLVEAADLIRAVDREFSTDAGNRADASQEAVLDEMRRILGNMLKWEGFQEAVSMLREIVRLQRSLDEETQEEIERRAAEILGDK